jgi:hypothetical protein
MRLIDIITLITDNSNVIITDLNNKEIARYDGKNSIPNKYNNKEVVEVSTTQENKNPFILLKIKLISL